MEKTLKFNKFEGANLKYDSSFESCSLKITK